MLIQTPQKANSLVVERDSGSFRDPDGFIVHIGDRVFRVLNKSGSDIWRKISNSKIWIELQGLVVGTEELSSSSSEYELIRKKFPQTECILEHNRIPMISYPPEWTPSMLIDAGLHTLKIQLILHKHGYTLKDASAYNIQFIGSRPVFIDITSIENPERLDIWHALGQFHRHFLYPALLHLRRKLDCRGMFITQIDGIQPSQAANLLGTFGWLRPSQLLSVYLPHWLSSKASGDSAGKPRKQGNPEVLKFTLGRLANKLKKIRRKIGGDSHWVDYKKTCTYSDNEREIKHKFIKKFADKYKPKRVTDFGSNTGEYSQIMADAGAYVVAVEADLDTADALYRNCSASKHAENIQVICTDLANPTPSYGHNGTERKSFFERHKADTALALALIHHLQSASRLSYEDIATLFSRLTDKHLLVEWIGPDDEMFKGMIHETQLDTSIITIDRFHDALSGTFPVVNDSIDTQPTRTVEARSV